MTLLVIILCVLAGVLASSAILLLPLVFRRPGAPAAGPIGTGAEGAVDAERKRAAVHEAGHTLAVWGCPFVSDVLTVEVFKGAGGGGRVTYTFLSDDHINVLWAKTVISLAGIASELSVYPRFHSASAFSDLSDARAEARAIVALGDVETPTWIECAVDGPPFTTMFRSGLSEKEAYVLRLAYNKARALVRARAASRDELVTLLLARSHVGGDELEAILGTRTVTRIVGVASRSYPFVG